jgi:hypothetical protein
MNHSEARAFEDTIHAMQVNIEQFQAYARRGIKKVEEISDAQLKEYVSMKLQRFVLQRHPLRSRYGFDIILFWLRRLHGGFSGFLGEEQMILSASEPCILDRRAKIDSRTSLVKVSVVAFLFFLVTSLNG